MAWATEMAAVGGGAPARQLNLAAGLGSLLGLDSFPTRGSKQTLHALPHPHLVPDPELGPCEPVTSGLFNTAEQ